MEKKIETVKPTDDLFEFLPIGSDVIEFSPEKVPIEYRPTFKIKQLTKKDKLEFTKLKMTMISLGQKMAKQVYDMDSEFEDVDKAIDKLSIVDDVDRISNRVADIIRKYIIGWEGFKDLEQNDFLYESDKLGLKKEIYDKVPEQMIKLLTDEILRISGLSEVEDNGLKF
jgi:hypothetical protein